MKSRVDRTQEWRKTDRPEFLRRLRPMAANTFGAIQQVVDFSGLVDKKTVKF